MGNVTNNASEPISFDSPALIELVKTHDITIIDHHESTPERVKDIDCKCIIDQKMCGCQLVWQFLTQQEMPKFFKYIADIDLWKNEISTFLGHYECSSSHYLCFQPLRKCFRLLLSRNNSLI